MQFGIFNLLPQPSGSVSVHQLAVEAVEQTRLAEAMNFDVSWFSEHHFSNYSMIPSPLIMSAFCAANTKKIRVGTAVLVVPLYHPLRLIEEIAFVDQLAQGRLAIGIGGGYQEHEFSKFGQNLQDSADMVEEFLDLLEMAFGRGYVEYSGKFHQYAPTPIAIQPFEGRMPQIFIAGLTKASNLQRRIVERGFIPFLSQNHKPAHEIAPMRAAVESIWNAAKTSQSKMRIATQRFIFVSRDKEEQRQAACQVLYTLRLGAALRRGSDGIENGRIAEVPFGGEPSLEDILKFAPIGDPDHVLEVLDNDIETLRQTHLSCIFKFGNLPHASVMKSMTAFGNEVMPNLARGAAEGCPA